MKNAAVVLGSFDGLHLGHKAVLRSAMDYENRIALVFSVPPAMEINGKSELLLPTDEKQRLFEAEGFRVETLDFAKVRNLEPQEFLSFLVKRFAPCKICCGFNYHFGAGGRGNIEVLKSFCEENNIKLSVANEVVMLGDRVSSSRIRALIKNGEVDIAEKLLTRPFSVFGVVAHGDERGRTIGFPTVNFPYPQGLVEAKRGVYAAECEIDGKVYKAVCYIGNRPSYKLPYTTVETHIIGFEGNLYDKKLTVALRRFLREEKIFHSLLELKDQLNEDIKKAR